MFKSHRAEETGFSPDFLRRHRLLQEEQVRRQQVLVPEAWDRAAAVAAILKATYHAEGVYLYGSLAWGGFAEGSDIDLFIVGFHGNYWQACVDAEKAACPFTVSIVCEEDAFPSLKEEVLAKGVRL